MLVYILLNPVTDLIKIGVTKNLKARISTLETGSGIPLKIVHSSILIENAYDIEEEIHLKLQKKRALGEWFYISTDEAKNVCNKTFNEKAIPNKLMKILNDKNYSITLTAKEIDRSKQRVSEILNSNYLSVNEIIKQLNAYKKFKPKVNQNKNITEIKSKKLNIITQIPKKAVKVKKHIYKHENKFYIKIYKNKKFILNTAESIQEANQKLLNIINL